MHSQQDRQIQLQNLAFGSILVTPDFACAFQNECIGH